MKRLFSMFSLVLAAALASAVVYAGSAPTASQSSAKSSSAMPAAKAEHMQGEVVSADTTANTLTIKTATGDSTLSVDPKAQAALRSVKEGEQVKLTYRESTPGEKTVVAIRAVRATATAHHAKSAKPSASSSSSSSSMPKSAK